MQTANITLDLGGDNGNQIPKSGVTAAEIAVLIAIHGEAAVHDIEPTGTVEISNRDELSRLHQVYGHARDGEDRSIVATLFPGAAARVFQTIDELGLPEEFFKPIARAKTDPLDHDGDGKKGGVKGRKAKAKVEPEAASEPEAQADEPEDDIAEMPDNSADGENLFQ